MHLHDPFGRVRVEPVLSREQRIALLIEAAAALLAGKLPSPDARLFIAGGLSAWLCEGGNLVRDYWQVSAPKGSHKRPELLAQKLRDVFIADDDNAPESPRD